MFIASSQVQAFYGGRMTEDRLLAVKNATCEAIDHLHRSLESCPGAEAESPDPRGLKVPTLQSGDESVPVTRLLSCVLCLTLFCSVLTGCSGVAPGPSEEGVGVAAVEGNSKTLWRHSG